MTKQEAKKNAEMAVYVNMNRGDIIDACARRGIKPGKDRSKMEQRLIEAMTEEYAKSE